MIIRDRRNFKSIIVRMLQALGYENVSTPESGAIDIIATKEGEKYCFKVSYDIDAIGASKVSALAEAARGNMYQHVVYVTNSSFLSAAKKEAESNGIELWDRNTIDRMSISIADEQLEEVEPEKKSPVKIIVPIAIGVVLVVAALLIFWFFFKK